VRRRPVCREPGCQGVQFVVAWQDEVGGRDDFRQRDVGAGRLRDRLVADGLAEHGVDDQVRAAAREASRRLMTELNRRALSGSGIRDEAAIVRS
jgi:hypothetical protein